MIFKPTLAEIVLRYENTSEINDKTHELFTRLTDQDPTLKKHTLYIEQNKLGFGDTAFHSMWARILELAVDRFKNVRACEIGVFKGQVISLWSLLASKNLWPLKISAVSPCEGDPLPPSRIKTFFLRFNKKFRHKIKIGEFYPKEDYFQIIKNTFSKFDLPFEEVVFHKSLSSNKNLLMQIKNEKYEIVYIDGDHSYEGALKDFKNFGPKVVKNGFLVADDAAFNLPGSTFWKGFESVTRAAEILPELGFRNILNVGHNRIYEKK